MVDVRFWLPVTAWHSSQYPRLAQALGGTEEVHAERFLGRPRSLGGGADSALALEGGVASCCSVEEALRWLWLGLGRIKQCITGRMAQTRVPRLVGCNVY